MTFADQETGRRKSPKCPALGRARWCLRPLTNRPAPRGGAEMVMEKGQVLVENTAAMCDFALILKRWACLKYVVTSSGKVLNGGVDANECAAETVYRAARN